MAPPIRYYDSSALVKRYVRERGSGTVRALLRSGERATCRLTFAEIASALASRLREGHVSARRLGILMKRVREDLARFHIIEMTPSLFDAAEPLLVRRPLRAADSLHLAAALRLRADFGSPELVCYDDRLSAAARAEGLPVRGHVA